MTEQKVLFFGTFSKHTSGSNTAAYFNALNATGIVGEYDMGAAVPPYAEFLSSGRKLTAKEQELLTNTGRSGPLWIVRSEVKLQDKLEEMASEICHEINIGAALDPKLQVEYILYENSSQ